MPAKKKTSKKKATKKQPRKASSKQFSFSNRILNCVPSKNPQQDWNYETALASGAIASGPIPRGVDLRDNSWWHIGDQQDTGSCVGWAAADSVLRWHFVKSRQIAKSELLSPRFTWMASKETDEFTSRPTTFIETSGTSLKAALDVALDYGAVRDYVLPFDSGQLYPDSAEVFYMKASFLRIANYSNLGRDPQKWRVWLANNGPILTRLDVDATWANASDTRGVLEDYMPATASGGHAVALVGYSPKHFIVRNSWGTSWGDGGFAYASLDYARYAFTEAYGVSI